jgi:site-specific recombinase XerD
MEKSKFLKGKAANTVKRYNQVLEDFEEFTGKELEKTTDADIFEYYDELLEREGVAARQGGNKQLAGSTVRNSLEVLRSAFEWLLRRGEIKVNPVNYAGIALPDSESNRKRPTEIIPFEKVTEICTKPDRRTKKGIRDRAILAILFGAGLRKSELLGLRLSDVIVTPHGSIYLHLRHTKRQKAENRTLADWARQSVAALVREHLTDGSSGENFLVQGYTKNKPSGQLSVRTIDRLFIKYCKASGVKGNFSPHSARATFCTKMFSDKQPIREIQVAMGHSSISSTIKYDKRNIEIDNPAVKKLSY